MDAEAACVQIEEINRLKKGKRLTLLFDGWEDKLHQSLYSTVAAQVSEYPTILSLDDLTGHRGSVNKYLEIVRATLLTLLCVGSFGLLSYTNQCP
jgi:hypothetical protein